MKRIITSIMIGYIIIWSVGCSPAAYYSNILLDEIGIESNIAMADVEGKSSYCHIYLIINNKPYEPRYFGLYLHNNIKYDEPCRIFQSKEIFVEEHGIFPSVESIIGTIMENVVIWG